MKTFIMMTVIFLFLGCGENGGRPESSITPPQPSVLNTDIAPPVSPILE